MTTLSLEAESIRRLLTGALFLATLVGVFGRPRGWHEAWWTCGGAALALALGLVWPAQALAVLAEGRDALVFLLALLLLSMLLDKSGFFEWAALVCARASKGEGRRVFRNFLFLGAAVTITLSLDTTAVLLTPLVLICAGRAGLPAKPFVVLCALVSNVASLLLPVSNLTNLLLVPLTGASFASFIAVQLLPQLVVLGVLWGGLAFWYRKEIPERFEVSSLPAPGSVVQDEVLFRAASAVLAAVLVGYFLAARLGFPAYAVAFSGVAVLLALAAARKRLRLSWFRELPLGVFPFAVGLFILVRALENLGLQGPAVSWLRAPRSTAELILGTAGATALASNLLNNLPAVLLGRSILGTAAAPPAAAFGVMLGANIGPCFGVYGSLATVLVLAEARRRGVVVQGRELVRLGWWLTPLMLLFGGAALWWVLAFVVPTAG